MIHTFMENICKQIKNNDSFICEKANDDFDLNNLARKYSLSIFYYDNNLTKSKRFGTELFVMKRDGYFIAHRNPGKLAKLPTGVNKLKGCKYKWSEIIKQDCFDDFDIDSDWKFFEETFGLGINIWSKVSSGLNMHKITNIRRSNLKPEIHLHCDKFFCKLFLITCDKLYFRGQRHLIK